MPNNNRNMHSAKRAKNDEFYTQLTDIENELQYYTQHFKNKIVLCNCNDAVHGDFKKYFMTHFNELGLKQLITTAYEEGYAEFYDGTSTIKKHFNGKGDFHSEEMIELLKKADIVCTNPPFSQFREYVAQLMEYDKKFLIIGNGNAVTYKEFFPLIKENKVWLGAGKGMGGKAVEFMVEESIYDASKGSVNRIENGICYVGVMMVTWFTNLDHQKRHHPLDLYKHYNEEEYPKYDNYDAINVDKVTDIPLDYDGVMGVPISFLDKYCPEQFEIIGIDRYVENNPFYGHRFTINGKEIYARILIKKICL